MAKVLTVNGIPYSFPEQGDAPPHGELIADWATAVTNTLGTLSNPTDILNSEFTIQNGVGGAGNSIVGLVFDSDLVRSAIVEYDIYRISDSVTTPKAETGTLYITYDGTSWEMSREASADTGVDLTITSAGQVKYSTSDIGAVGYIGAINYRSRTFSQ